ncbi:unnamed protein product [Cochlearia groenlandica]
MRRRPKSQAAEVTSSLSYRCKGKHKKTVAKRAVAQSHIATLLWNLNLASATILVGARASSLLGVLFTGHPRCSVISTSGKQNYRASPAPDNKTLGARLLSAILGTNASRCSASLGFRAHSTKLETVGSKA